MRPLHFHLRATCELDDSVTPELFWGIINSTRTSNKDRLVTIELIELNKPFSLSRSLNAGFQQAGPGTVAVALDVDVDVKAYF